MLDLGGFFEGHYFHCVYNYILSERFCCLDTGNVKLTSYMKFRKEKQASTETSHSLMKSLWLHENSDQSMPLNVHVLRYEFT